MNLDDGTPRTTIYRWAIRIVATTILDLAALPLAAQTTPLPDAPQSQLEQQGPRMAPKEHQHALGPKTTYNVHGDKELVFEPLTPSEKFAISYTHLYSPMRIFSTAFSATINQATETPSGWGEGDEAYAKRYGSAVVHAATADFFGRSLLPTLLHQDPRYYSHYETGIMNRAFYAATREFVTRTDSGHNTINLSVIGGQFAAAAATHFYYPRDDRGGALEIARRAGVSMSAGMGVNVLREFWPDIRTHLFHRHHAEAPQN